MKKIICLALLFFLIFSCAGAGCTLREARGEESESARTSPSESTYPRYIIHGAGVLEGIDPDGNLREFFGSNSVEALEKCGEFYADGSGLIELDFNFTSDGELVCIHNWSPEYISGIPMGVPLSHEEFLASEIFWNYTPLDLDYLGDFLRRNPSILVVTDIKDENIRGAKKIAEDCPDLLDRFIIQIYSESEYDAVRECGFDKIIYTLYMLPWADKTDTDALAEFARSHHLFAYTFPAELCEIDGFLDSMKKFGVPLFVHTLNDTTEIASYLERGISGIYTDYLRAD